MYGILQTSPTMKCKAVNAYIKKKAQISNLSLHLARKGRETKLKARRRNEKSNISSQINIQKRKTKEINFKQKLLQTGQQK